MLLPAVEPASAATGPAGFGYEVVTEGQPLTLAAEVGSGDDPFTYQWYKDGAPVSGATRQQFTLAATTHGDAGLYAVVVANGAGSAASLPVQVHVSSAQPSRLANVSIIASASEAVVVGFTLTGTAAESTRFLVRAAGPALVQFGVTGTLPDPTLELLGPAGALAANDNWGGGDLLTATAASVGAFSFPTDSRDSALIADLSAGAFTARVVDATGRTGTTAIELYEVRRGATRPSTRLVNLSAQAVTGDGSSPFTLGFTLEGHDPVRLLVRGIGPGLTRFGVSNALGDPRLHLFRSSVLVASNDDWGDVRAADIAGAATAAGAFSLVGGSKDAALLVTLDPGSYTVQLGSGLESGGLGLIELYAVP